MLSPSAQGQEHSQWLKDRNMSFVWALLPAVPASAHPSLPLTLSLSQLPLPVRPMQQQVPCGSHLLRSQSPVEDQDSLAPGACGKRPVKSAPAPHPTSRPQGWKGDRGAHWEPKGKPKSQEKVSMTSHFLGTLTMGK